MKQQKIIFLTYGLLVASVIGSIVDRPSRAPEPSAGHSPPEVRPWQNGDSEEEHTIIVTRFLFPEKPKKPDLP